MRALCQTMVAIGALFSISTATHAQSVATVRLSPEYPRAGETVYAVYTSPQPCMAHLDVPAEVRLENRTFTIRYRLRTNVSAPCENGVRTVTELGRLPEGDFQVVASFDVLPNPPFTLPVTATQAEATFSVQSRTEENGPVNNVSGMWYDSGDPGWALTLYQQGDDRLLGSWSTYDAEGTPTWFFLLPGHWVDRGIYEAAIGQASNGPFFGRDNPVLPAEPSVRVVGSAQIIFSASAPVEGGGKFTYTVNGLTTSRPLRHFAY